MTNLVECRSPIDGSICFTRPLTPLGAAADLVAAARTAQRDWAARPLADRVALVEDGIRRLGAMNAEIVPELAWTIGRPVRYGGEFGGVAERATYMAGIAETALAPIVIEASDAFERRITREPHGVVLVIAPWNYPYLTAINSVVPALIAGNAVVLKHARQTLLAGERIARAFAEAGLPDGLLVSPVLDHDTTAALIRRRSFGFINFTGSVAGGRTIEQAAAGTFTGVGLELGGKDPGYVMDDADLDAAVAGLVDAAIYNSGQCCCGIERIYVAAPLFDAFVERAAALIAAYRLGNPLDPGTTLGPMAERRFAAEVRAQVAEAVAAGARPLIDRAGFPADDGDGAYVAPQLLVDVTDDMRVMRDETFGPVIGVAPVADDEEAVARINDSDFGLTVSLWGRDPARAVALGARLETGTVYLNRADYLDPALCWTGRKDAGRGGALSVIGYHSLTRPKSWHFRKQLG